MRNVKNKKITLIELISKHVCEHNYLASNSIYSSTVGVHLMFFVNKCSWKCLPTLIVVNKYSWKRLRNYVNACMLMSIMQTSCMTSNIRQNEEIKITLDKLKKCARMSASNKHVCYVVERMITKYSDLSKVLHLHLLWNPVSA